MKLEDIAHLVHSVKGLADPHAQVALHKIIIALGDFYGISTHCMNKCDALACPGYDYREMMSVARHCYNTKTKGIV
jgi:hypothetical protein